MLNNEGYVSNVLLLNKKKILIEKTDFILNRSSDKLLFLDNAKV